MNETLNEDFTALTEENRKSVIEMTRFLVLTQNTIVPKLLTSENGPLSVEGDGRELVDNFANTGHIPRCK